MYGDITFRVAEQMRKPEMLEFFAKMIQRTSPKSYVQAHGEAFVTTKFLENFCGDQVR
jgi:1-pyrroline-5-carboxylate dehydrogenase